MNNVDSARKHTVMHKKDFDLWNSQKKKIEGIATRVFFKERQVWFCSLGTNVGDEEDGKGPNHERPILIIKKFNNSIFLGLPLSTKIKDNNKFYYKINVKDVEASAMISQIRLLDAKRLKRKVCFIEQDEFENLKNEIISINFKNRTDPIK